MAYRFCRAFLDRAQMQCGRRNYRTAFHFCTECFNILALYPHRFGQKSMGPSKNRTTKGYRFLEKRDGEFRPPAPTAHPASIRQYILFRLRFCYSADIAGAFDSFVGLVVPISKIGLFWNLAVIQSPDPEIAYGQHLHNNRASIARDRTKISITTR